MSAASDSFRIYGAPGGIQTARAAMHEMWTCIHAQYPEAEKFDLRGVGILLVEPGEVGLRFAADFDTGFLACEGSDRKSGDHWELFVIAAPQGVITTGWRREGAFASEAPDAWMAGAMLLELPPAPPAIAAPLGAPLIGANSIHLAMANSIALAMVADAARQSVKRVLAQPTVAIELESA